MKYLLPILWLLVSGLAAAQEYRATGDLGLVVARADGQVHLLNHSRDALLAKIEGLGDLSHASLVYSRDQRYAYVFGRDGGLTKVDLLTQTIARRVIQAGNSIGGAISQDGKLVAVSNYTPGGVRVFDAETLELVADIPATPVLDPKTNETRNAKVVGLVDAPDNRFVFSLFDTDEIWLAQFDGRDYQLQKFAGVGRLPYDALISPDGRYYLAGLFGEPGMAKLDLWHPERGVQRILPDYGDPEKKLPVYKMPHLEGWAIAGNRAFVPAVGQHQVLVINMQTWQQEAAIAVQGQPVFVMARPDGRQVWVNFAHPDNGVVQVIDTDSLAVIKALQPGPAVLHMEFTPRGEKVWLSVRDANEVQVYNTRDFSLQARLKVPSPSGIFFTDRAHQVGL